MDEDFEIELPARVLPGVDLTLWLNIVLGIVAVALVVTAVVLLV